MSSGPVYRMCAQVAPSAEYLRGHGRVAVDVTALRRLWQHLPVLGLVVLACVPVCAVLRSSLLCNSCGLSAVKINEEELITQSSSGLRSPKCRMTGMDLKVLQAPEDAKSCKIAV